MLPINQACYNKMVPVVKHLAETISFGNCLVSHDYCMDDASPDSEPRYGFWGNCRSLMPDMGLHAHAVTTVSLILGAEAMVIGVQCRLSDLMDHQENSRRRFAGRCYPSYSRIFPFAMFS